MRTLVRRVSRSAAAAVLLVAAVALSPLAHANGTSISYTGTLANPETTVEVALDLSSASTITLQTYGFGGGTNQARTVINPGGTDPFLAIFSGLGSSATILTDGSGNPYGTSLDLLNYSSFMGCGPAGAPTIGGSPVCGDITMTLSLAMGKYTVVLSDGQYQAEAVVGNPTLPGYDPTLGGGFIDYTGYDPTTTPITPGQFCNISINNVACPANSPTFTDVAGNGAYALDISGLPSTSVTPEPGTFVLYASGLTLVGLIIRKRRLLQPR